MEVESQKITSSKQLHVN